MQELIVRQSNGHNIVYDFYDASNFVCEFIDSDEYVHFWGSGSRLIHSINSAFPSWVLIVGEGYDVVFYGSNAQGSALAHGDLSSLTVPKSCTKVNWFAQPISFGLLLRASEFSDSLHFLQAEGVFPQLPLDTALSPAVVDNVRYRFYRSW